MNSSQVRNKQVQNITNLNFKKKSQLFKANIAKLFDILALISGLGIETFDNFSTARIKTIKIFALESQSEHNNCTNVNHALLPLKFFYRFVTFDYMNNRYREFLNILLLSQCILFHRLSLRPLSEHIFQRFHIYLNLVLSQ